MRRARTPLWVCFACGHVGCGGDSPNQYATKHFYATGHALIRSVEPGETWGRCYLDEVAL
ncbi:MAG: UBP-type zinc finger domain-containing protein [Bacteroidota bacterium]